MGADARMPGRVAPSWCWVCGGPSGMDCPDRGKTSRAIRRAEQRQVRREADAAAGERADTVRAGRETS